MTARILGFLYCLAFALQALAPPYPGVRERIALRGVDPTQPGARVE